jgi:hypothetical protein
MLKNLLKAWSILAPNEYDLIKSDPGLETEDRMSFWILQGVIQHRIELRAWSFGLTSDQGQEFSAKVEVDPIKHIEFNVLWANSAHEALFTAYLTLSLKVSGSILRLGSRLLMT